STVHWIEFQRLAEPLDRLLDLSVLEEREGVPVAESDVVRSEVNGLPECGDGLRVLFLARVEFAEVPMRVEKFRVQLPRLLESVHRLVYSSHLAQRAPEIVTDDRGFAAVASQFRCP